MLGHPMSSRFSFGNIRINAISRFYDSFVICDENLKKEINIRESINTLQVKQEDIKKTVNFSKVFDLRLWNHVSSISHRS